MPRVHIIQTGETLADVAEECYGQVSALQQLAQYNGIRNTDWIRAHQQILIPSYIELTGNGSPAEHKNPPPHGLNKIMERFGNIYDYFRNDGALLWKWEEDQIIHCDIPFSIPLLVNPAMQIKKI